MIIEVTQKHIDNGLELSCKKCPVALALWDAGFETVHINYHFISAESEFFYLSEYNSDYIKNKIIDFDKGIKISPFSFSIKIQISRYDE